MAENPYVNKVEYGSNTLIDLTADTVTPQTLLEGATAHDRSGAPISGAVAVAPASSTTPAIDGTASAGTENAFARGDHVHPTDTSRAAANNVVALDSEQTITGPKTFAGEVGMVYPGSEQKTVIYVDSADRLRVVSVDQIIISIAQTASRPWISVGNLRIAQIAPPTSDTDAANKQYVDSAVANVRINFQVGVERPYGTYTDENGVLYQSYSKTIYIPALPAEAGITNYPHGITGIKQILQVYGFTTDGFVLNAPRQNVQDNISIYQAQKAGNIAIEVGKDRSSKKAYVTLIYAKNN